MLSNHHLRAPSLRAGNVVHLVEYLLSIHETLGSVSSTENWRHIPPTPEAEEDQKLKVILHCTVSLRSAWAT